MKRLTSLFLAFLVGLIFMIYPLRPSIVSGYFISAVGEIFQLIGFLSVIIFGMVLLVNGFRSLRS